MVLLLIVWVTWQIYAALSRPKLNFWSPLTMTEEVVCIHP